MDITPKADREDSSTLLRIVIGVFAGFFSSYLLNQCSLHGIDFKTAGVDSEVVKSALQGTVIGLLVAPRNIVYSVVDGILFVRFFFTNVWKAIRYGKKVDEQE